MRLSCPALLVPLFSSGPAGSATRLESQFRLTYSMILNLLRVEDLKVGRGSLGLSAWQGGQHLPMLNRHLTLLYPGGCFPCALAASPGLLQVEDMLKRSFAEFHAQRAHPELLQALEKGQAALARLRARPWPASPLATARCPAAAGCG